MAQRLCARCVVFYFFQRSVIFRLENTSNGSRSRTGKMEKTFLELISENQSILFKICNVYFREKVDKEDYHLELIIQLWKAFPDFKNTAKFSTWMYRVCINAAIDILRKEKKEIKKISLSKEHLHHMPDHGYVTTRNQDRLYELISQLSHVDRAIITLYLEEYSYREIAEIIGISESNTGVKINRIKSRILKSLKNGRC